MESIENIAGIYWIRNLVNGKFYIGSTNDVKVRHRNHRSELNRGEHDNHHLQNAWNKYGAKSFKFEVLESIKEVEKIEEIEQWYLSNTRCLDRNFGYNICPRADRRSMSDETKAKIRQALKGRKIGPHDANHCKKISDGLKGRLAWNKGKNMSDSCRAAIKKSWIARKANQERQKYGSIART